jgi:hypothetical protein
LQEVGSGGDVAQLGEHLLCKQGVAGSIPVISTIRGGSGKFKSCVNLLGSEGFMELLSFQRQKLLPALLAGTALLGRLVL